MINKEAKFLIVGLGLIGGSIAMKLSELGYKVYAIDIDKKSLESEDKLAKHHTIWVEEFLLKNSKIIRDAVANKKLYIAKCHLSHKTGRVHLIDSYMHEFETEEI